MFLSLFMSQARKNLRLFGKGLVLVKLKANPEKRLKVVQMTKFVYDRVEIIMGKGDYAGNKHPLSFSQCCRNPCSSWQLLL